MIGNSTLACTEAGVFVWPGFALVERRGASFVRRSERDVCNLVGLFYSTQNAEYGGQSPRDYLRGKTFEEQYQFGLRVLRDHGVLK